jgi:hypothetical protein
MNQNCLEQIPESELASTRTNSINHRISERNIPSQPLQPYFDSRPVSTKYSIMPIVDPRKPIHVPVKQLPTYNPEHIFNPGTAMAPWSGFVSNINNESILRNQIYGLQSCSQSIYVPTSKSDLYQLHWKQQSNVQQPFPNLFQSETFNTYNPNPNPELLGYALYNNATRQQNKDLKC